MSKPFSLEHLRPMSILAFPTPKHSVLFPLMLLVSMTASGCNKSDSSAPTIVPPPTPNIPSTPSSVDPPGSIEMPPGDIDPASDADAEKTGIEGGLEMPADATIDGAVESGNAGAAEVDEAEAEPGDTSGINVGYQKWDEIVAAATSSGKITVVDLWSLSCEPCLKEFPGLVRLAEQFGETVACVSVNLEFDGRKSRPPEYYQDRVVAFLRSVDARGVRHLISQTPNEDVFAATKIASIPAVFVYNAEGEIVQVFVDAGETAGFTYEKDVLPLVTKLAS